MSSTIKSLFSAIKTIAIVGEATANEISYGSARDLEEKFSDARYIYNLMYNNESTIATLENDYEEVGAETAEADDQHGGVQSSSITTGSGIQQKPLPNARIQQKPHMKR